MFRRRSAVRTMSIASQIRDVQTLTCLETRTRIEEREIGYQENRTEETKAADSLRMSATPDGAALIRKLRNARVGP